MLQPCCEGVEVWMGFLTYIKLDRWLNIALASFH